MIRPKLVSRSILVCNGLLGLALCVPLTRGRAGADGSPADASKEAMKSDVIRRIGYDSCLARGCHGAVGATDPARGDLYFKGGEATTWRSFDPHSRAYDVLRNPRSVRMGKILSAKMKQQPPHRARLCLDCHSIGGTPSDSDKSGRHDFASGVDCETCHGPASEWVEPHLSATWLSRNEPEKQKLGYRSMVDLADRAKLCVTCHLGTPSKQVNHDLIAAGHPRLIFELDAYLTALPRHWREPHEKVGTKAAVRDFHAKAWAVGQVETTEAILRLLRSRAESAARDEAPWPEFAEYDCFACHHELASPSWRQAEGSRQPPGSLPWGSWTLPTLLPLAQGPAKSTPGESSASLIALKKEMERHLPDPARVAQLADESSQWLRTWRSAPESLAFDARRAESLLRVFLDPKTKPTSWDEAGARSLAVTSLSKAVADLTGRSIAPALANEADALRRSLDYPRSSDSPKGFHP